MDNLGKGDRGGGEERKVQIMIQANGTKKKVMKLISD